MVGVNDINPFSNFNIGLGDIGNALFLFAISVIIVGLVGWLIYWRITSKQYKYKIPLYKSISGVNFKQADHVARAIPISKAGDCLWFVRGVGKYLSPATLSNAPNSYPHEEREDGEWINFSISSVNDEQKKAGVHFIHQDMRSQRVATAQILEQRLINKSFWEKYKDMITHLIFYIIVTLLMIVTFWQWGNIADKTALIIDKVDSLLKNVDSLTCIETKNKGIIPAIMFLFWRKKK